MHIHLLFSSDSRDFVRFGDTDWANYFVCGYSLQMSPFTRWMKIASRITSYIVRIVGKPERSHPGWMSLQALQERSSQILSTTHCRCFWLHSVDTSLSAESHIIYLERYALPQHPPQMLWTRWKTKAVEMRSIILGKESLLLWSFLQSTVSICDISATSVFVCGRHTIFIIWDESPRKGA